MIVLNLDAEGDKFVANSGAKTAEKTYVKIVILTNKLLLPFFLKDPVEACMIGHGYKHPILLWRFWLSLDCLCRLSPGSPPNTNKALL